MVLTFFLIKVNVKTNSKVKESKLISNSVEKSKDHFCYANTKFCSTPSGNLTIIMKKWRPKRTRKLNPIKKFEKRELQDGQGLMLLAAWLFDAKPTGTAVQQKKNSKEILPGVVCFQTGFFGLVLLFLLWNFV